jgi:hypothetical protein
MYIKFLPKVRGGAQRAEGSVVLGQLLYYYQNVNSVNPFRNKFRGCKIQIVLTNQTAWSNSSFFHAEKIIFHAEKIHAEKNFDMPW